MYFKEVTFYFDELYGWVAVVIHGDRNQIIVMNDTPSTYHSLERYISANISDFEITDMNKHAFRYTRKS